MRAATSPVVDNAATDTNVEIAAQISNLYEAMLSVARAHIADLQARNDQLEAARKSSFASTHELASAAHNPAAKNKVLDAMHIIATPLAANLLGVPQRELRSFAWKTDGLFGKLYDGRWCYSLNELQLFAKNQGWFENKPGHFKIDSARARVHLSVCVQADIARAYLNCDAHVLRFVFGQRRRFRLGELNKVLAARCAGVEND